jgi:hypothetical protein
LAIDTIVGADLGRDEIDSQGPAEPPGRNWTVKVLKLSHEIASPLSLTPCCYLTKGIRRPGYQAEGYRETGISGKGKKNILTCSPDILIPQPDTPIIW